MRKVVPVAQFALVAAFVVAQTGCKKETASDPSSGVTPAAVAAPAVPAQPEYAPPGVFYVIGAARVETANGIVGLKPGTGVKKIRPGFYLTPYGEVALKDSEVTNDMALARQVAKQDAAQQQQVQKAIEARKLEVQAAQVKVAAAQAAANPIPAAPQPAAQPAQPPQSVAPKLPPPSNLPMQSKSSLGGSESGSRMSTGGLGAKQSGNEGRIYVDSTGKKYWKDQDGRPRYDF